MVGRYMLGRYVLGRYVLGRYVLGRYMLGLYGVYTAIVLAAAAAAWVYLPRTYEVTAIISVKPGLYGGEPATGRSDQVVRSQVALLESESVIREAIDVVGAANLYPTVGRAGPSANRDFIRGAPRLSAQDQAYAAAKRRLAVKHEALTDLIRVSFRHGDPDLAMEFTRGLVEKFIHRYFELYTNAATVSFSRDHQRRSSEEYIRASAALAQFSTANQIYSIDEQQKLLLEQRSRLHSALFATKGTIADKNAQAAAIPGQLSQMTPIGRLPQVTGLTRRNDKSPAEKQPQIENLASDPPLLLVRVYQDTVASLVKLHTDLAGLRALEANQELMLRETEETLSQLSTKRAEFEQLKLAMGQARENSEFFTRKAHEAQLAQEQNAKNLSSVQIVQHATKPLEPIWPTPAILGAATVALSLLPIGAALTYRVVASTKRAPMA